MFTYFWTVYSWVFVWQECFAGLEDDEGEDLEVDTMAKDYQSRGGMVVTGMS